MSHFKRAFVFCQEPQWEALRALPARHNLRGYRHRDHESWLLAEFNFHRRPGFLDWRGEDATASFPALSRARLERAHQAFEACLDAELASRKWPSGWLGLSFEVARLARASTFFFVSDDEHRDDAWQVTPAGVLQRLALQVGPGTLTLDGDDGVKLTVIDTASEYTAACAGLPSRVPWLKLDLLSADPRPFGYQFNSHSLWPLSAGAAREALEIGSWNSFGQLEREFELVFERITEPGPEDLLEEMDFISALTEGLMKGRGKPG